MFKVYKSIQQQDIHLVQNTKAALQKLDFLKDPILDVAKFITTRIQWVP